MNIKTFNGIDNELYSLVAPLVMNAEVLKQNDNAAFKTSASHTWIVAIDDSGTCVGFLPYAITAGEYKVNNYYAKNRDEETMTAMIKEAIKNIGKGKCMMVVTQKADFAILKKLGFKMANEFVKCAFFTKSL